MLFSHFYGLLLVCGGNHSKMATNVVVRMKRRNKCRRKLLLAGAVWYLFWNNRKQTTRTIWTREWLLRRDDLGAFDTLLSELRAEDEGSFLNFLRLSPGLFDHLVERVRPLIQRQDTCFRKAISPAMRLAITLRYLATGETFKSLSYLFRVGNNTIGQIVPEMCAAIYQVLKEEYFKCPTKPAEWEEVAKDFWDKWNFPNCLGALDGKHIAIKQPACSGAKFFNYKHHFSIILLALSDANYKFLFCDIGSQGRCSDAGVYNESDLHSALERNTLGVPDACPLPGRQDPFPYCVVADDAFPLKHYLMKPYPYRHLSAQERIFNYRLSRARRCIENAFGIMANRFRVLLNPICLSPNKVDFIVLACCALHNMLRSIAPTRYGHQEDKTPANAQNTHPGQLPAAKVAGRRSVTQAAKQYRQYLCDYFVSPEGSVPWQDEDL